MEETIRQPSFQLPHLPDDVIPSTPAPQRSHSTRRQSIPPGAEGEVGPDALYEPCDQESVWFSCAELYTKTQTLSSGEENELCKTHPIIKFWSSVRDAKFAGQMSVLFLHPDIKDEMYVFAGTLMAKIDTAHSLFF
jgi:hypothetical protein